MIGWKIPPYTNPISSSTSKRTQRFPPSMQKAEAFASAFHCLISLFYSIFSIPRASLRHDDALAVDGELAAAVEGHGPRWPSLPPRGSPQCAH